MLIDSVDFFRLDANRKIDPEQRSGLGQFMTPPATAKLMASMFEARHTEIRLLDAGVGSLTAAFVSEICDRKYRPNSLHVTAYEIDPKLCDYLCDTLCQCQKTCENAGMDFDSDVVNADFIDRGARMLRDEMFSPINRYDCCNKHGLSRTPCLEGDRSRDLKSLHMKRSNQERGDFA